MPANLSPAFLAARDRLNRAKTDEERLDALQEMLATIPKHKGTEKMQADIRRRVAKLKEKAEQQRRSGKGGGVAYHVPREGAAQVALVGAPNAGKSSLLAALTNASPEIAPYPMSTHHPLPGMMEFEDIQIQLVDLPPITRDYTEGWVYGLVRLADTVALCVNLENAGWQKETEEIIALLATHHTLLTARSRQVDWRVVERRAIALGLKADLGRDRVPAFRAWAEGRFTAVSASTATGEGMDEVRTSIFRSSGVVRVYTKKPGQAPDLSKPYTIREGATVLNVVEQIHKDFVSRLRYVRLWGSGRFEGQHAPQDHPVQDKDIVEIHLS
jgi:ribosome-interacting GTPase 1